MNQDHLENLRDAIAAVPLLTSDDPGAPGVPWIVSDPVHLSSHEYGQLEQMGRELKEFLARAWKCHEQSNIRQAFHESLSDDERAGFDRLSNPVRNSVLVRLDLILDEQGAFQVVEMDLVPAGAGKLQRFQEVYGQTPTIADLWAEHVDEPIVLSIPEWKIFVPEQRYFAQCVTERGGRLEFVPIEAWDQLNNDGRLIFKNCCTISLLNSAYPPCVPSASLTPPGMLDWKGWMALAHSEQPLQDLRFTKHIPPTYLLPLRGGDQTALRREFLDLSTRQRRRWILKPSTDWGSRGFVEAQNLNQDDFNRRILGYADDDVRGMILQQRIESRRFEMTGLDVNGAVVTADRLRIRLNPYYLLWNNRSYLCGVTVCLRRSIKVHGATDAFITLALPRAE